MSEHDFTKEVFDKIKDVKPKPRWQFRLQNIVVWFLGFMSLLLGSLSFSVILYMMINNDWDLSAEIGGSQFKFLLMTLPYLWLVFLTLFVLVAYYNFKNTKKGYRFPFYQVLTGSVVASIIFGAVFHGVGVGQAIEDGLNRRVPIYQKIFNPRSKIWTSHDQGFLGGVIVDYDDDQIIVQDIDGDLWYVTDISTNTPQIFEIETGGKIRIMGNQIDSEHFEADIILPMKGMHWMAPPPPMMSPEEMQAFHERKVKGMRIIR